MILLCVAVRMSCFLKVEVVSTWQVTLLFLVTIKQQQKFLNGIGFTDTRLTQHSVRQLNEAFRDVLSSLKYCAVYVALHSLPLLSFLEESAVKAERLAPNKDLVCFQC